MLIRSILSLIRDKTKECQGHTQVQKYKQCYNLIILKCCWILKVTQFLYFDGMETERLNELLVGMYWWSWLNTDLSVSLDREKRLLTRQRLVKELSWPGFSGKGLTIASSGKHFYLNIETITSRSVINKYCISNFLGIGSKTPDFWGNDEMWLKTSCDKLEIQEFFKHGCNCKRWYVQSATKLVDT